LYLWTLIHEVSTNMITEIGFAAGDIWKLLDQKERLELAEVMKQIPRSKELILMALGWLCREGHIVIIEKDNKHFIELRKIKA